MYCFLFFFFNDTATTEIYTLSLHDALPICFEQGVFEHHLDRSHMWNVLHIELHSQSCARAGGVWRSEEHTSELQSQSNLVCRLLLEKKKKKKKENRLQQINTN